MEVKLNTLEIITKNSDGLTMLSNLIYFRFKLLEVDSFTAKIEQNDSF